MEEEQKKKMIQAMKDATEILEESGLRQFQSDIIKLGIEIYKEEGRGAERRSLHAIACNTGR